MGKLEGYSGSKFDRLTFKDTSGNGFAMHLDEIKLHMPSEAFDSLPSGGMAYGARSFEAMKQTAPSRPQAAPVYLNEKDEVQEEGKRNDDQNA